MTSGQFFYTTDEIERSIFFGDTHVFDGTMRINCQPHENDDFRLHRLKRAGFVADETRDEMLLGRLARLFVVGGRIEIELNGDDFAIETTIHPKK